MGTQGGEELPVGQGLDCVLLGEGWRGLQALGSTRDKRPHIQPGEGGRARKVTPEISFPKVLALDTDAKRPCSWGSPTFTGTRLS